MLAVGVGALVLLRFWAQGGFFGILLVIGLLFVAVVMLVSAVFCFCGHEITLDQALEQWRASALASEWPVGQLPSPARKCILSERRIVGLVRLEQWSVVVTDPLQGRTEFKPFEKEVWVSVARDSIVSYHTDSRFGQPCFNFVVKDAPDFSIALNSEGSSEIEAWLVEVWPEVVARTNPRDFALLLYRVARRK